MDGGQNMELQKDSSHPSASLNANLSATTTAIQKWLEKLRKERKKKGYLGDSINGKTNNTSVKSCGNQLRSLANNSWVLQVTVCIEQFHHPSNYATLSLSLTLCTRYTLFSCQKKKRRSTLLKNQHSEFRHVYIKHCHITPGPFIFYFFKNTIYTLNSCFWFLKNLFFWAKTGYILHEYKLQTQILQLYLFY